MNLKQIYIGFLLLLIALPSIAQREQGDLESVRIAFFTKKLALTPNEAKVFWPVYDAYQSEVKAVKTAMRRDLKAAKNNFADMSDAEIENAVDHYLKTKRDMVDVSEKYHSQFKQVLPIRKVAMLYKAEQEFTKLLLKRLRQPGNGRSSSRRAH
ncbi:MAG TPA: hypothetical protein ENJ82_00695 [Bacteroidetes bacterium]|nr:hypothetical protein [Bacteroidota bacterium]